MILVDAPNSILRSRATSIIKQTISNTRAINKHTQPDIESSRLVPPGWNNAGHFPVLLSQPINPAVHVADVGLELSSQRIGY